MGMDRGHRVEEYSNHSVNTEEYRGKEGKEKNGEMRNE